MARFLGRRRPKNFNHVAKYGLIAEAPAVVNKVLTLPYYHKTWDQNGFNACVGFGSSMGMAIMNTIDWKAAGRVPYTHRYDPFWLWNETKKIDPWPETNPGDNEGTSVSYAFDVLLTKGHIRLVNGTRQGPFLGYGVKENRWAESVDDIRACIAAGNPVVIGTDWYSGFSNPELINNEYWIGTNGLGAFEGGHCTCIYGAYDRRLAFRVKNSWLNYPLVWLPYSVMEKLLYDYGEATIVTDREL